KPGTGWYSNDLQGIYATLTAKLGGSNLTAISGYNVSDNNDSLDFGGVLLNHFRTNKFTQEIRVTTPIGQRVDWLLGAFYAHENTNPMHQEWWLAADPITGKLAGLFASYDSFQPSSEIAAFTDVTWKFTDRFDIQIGGRESQIRLASHTITTTF